MGVKAFFTQAPHDTTSKQSVQLLSWLENANIVPGQTYVEISSLAVDCCNDNIRGSVLAWYSVLPDLGRSTEITQQESERDKILSCFGVYPHGFVE